MKQKSYIEIINEIVSKIKDLEKDSKIGYKYIFKVRNKVLDMAESNKLLDNFEDSAEIISLIQEKCDENFITDRIFILLKLEKDKLDLSKPLYLNFYAEKKSD